MPAAGRRVTATTIVVDALFGTGLARPLTGTLVQEVERLNALGAGGARLIAVDVPSGLAADTGQPHGACVRAHRTVTIGLPKRGLALEPGRSLAGAIDVARIGIADRAPGGVAPAVGLWTPGAFPDLDRPADAHKGGAGHVLVAAGSVGKTGAAALCAIAAGRTGAGLVTLACPDSLNDILEAHCAEAMTMPVAEHAGRAFAQGAHAELVRLAAERDAVALGPGIGRSDETQKLAAGLVAEIVPPLVLDADGLYSLDGVREAVRGRSAPTVLTPHPGEAARLLGSSAAAINADRISAAQRLSDRFGAVVVLKGAATVVAEPGGRALVNPTGGPALATGGTGDVLTGVVAALLARGLDAFEAAAAAAYLHGAAGDRVARLRGAVGGLAGDVAEALPEAIADLRRRSRRLAGSRGPGTGGTSGGLLLRFPDP